MRKEGVIGCSVIGATIVILFRYLPDYLSMVIVLLMVLLIGCGFFVGVLPVMRLSTAFHVARKCIHRARGIQTSNLWYVIRMEEKVFEHKELDRIFDEYRQKVEECLNEDDIVSSIEEYINEDYIALSTWRSLLIQIPSTLTGLGILGTFLGLILGINNLGFSSIVVMKGSIENLIGGIRVAFYTSIGGIILSILFNLFYNIVWDIMVREMELFYGDFHKYVIPTTKEQIRKNDLRFQKELLNYNHTKVVECLENILEKMES